MSNDEFTKLFKYMIGRFDSIEKILETKAGKNDVDKLVNIIDGYADKIDSYAMEMAAMQHKIDRLERYIQVLANNAGIDLEAIHV